ncbi:thymidine phosphorylase [Myxococcota bacterium]|nr:thymidine phosphorylase [Myxococcota bacterium]MBU1430827.1 thymidine phosphorylase [Myxococcota bacterium]MBU1898248.1 thymidine phosphorylase [Myxococcota bacterium]
MRTVDLIERKRDGGALRDEEIYALIDAYTRGDVPDYQMSALLMTIYLKGFSGAELAAWTDAMLRSGEVLDLSSIPGVKVDKHSTGGVGDKISLPLAPLVAACGVPVPMVSGRGLGHTGGTLDKLESIPGFSTQQPVERFIELVATIGLGLIGQTAEIAPADKKLYALRDVTGTVPSIPLITSSIMSKKLAEGIDGLVLDVKVGSGAFMKTEADARALAEAMVGVGQRMGRRVVALLTNMDQPLGRAVGNALEVRESIDILKGCGPEDTTALTLGLAYTMLDMAAKPTTDVDKALSDGRGLAKFAEIIEAQGGDPRVIDDPNRLPTARYKRDFLAPRDGYISAIDAQGVGLAALVLGAGRATKEEDIDPAVGLMLHKRLGDKVKAGEPILTLEHNDRGVDDALHRLTAAYTLSDEAPPAAKPLFIDRIGG